MLLTDYKNRVFDYLSEKFRRLAEFLRVKTEARETENPVDETAPAGWLEKTRHIPAGRWIDFSGESEPEEMKSAGVETAGTPAFENKTETRISAKQDKAEKTPANPSTEKSLPEKARPKRFLRFEFSDGETRRQNASESEEMPDSPADEIRVSPYETKNKSGRTSPFLLKLVKPKKSEAPADSASEIAFPLENAGSEPPPASRENRERKSGDAGNKEQSRRPPTDSIKTAFRRETSGSAFEKKSMIETVFGNEEKAKAYNRTHPERKTKPPETQTFKPSGESENKGVGSFRTEKNEVGVQTRGSENSGKSASSEPVAEKKIAAPPWVDLPADGSANEFEEIKESVAKIEHLLYLEREQRGGKEIYIKE